MTDLLDRYKGCLIGLAVGDAVGVTNEFKPRAHCDENPVTDMVGGGAFWLAPGEYTDDTSMALCLANSLLECKGFDLRNQLQKYLLWYREGYMSSIGHCFDIGYQTTAALKYFEQTNNELLAGFIGRHHDGTVSAGNGSLMRLAPIPMYYYPDIKRVGMYAGASSISTHANSLCIDICQTYALMICDAFFGKDKKQICVQPMVYDIIKEGLGKSREQIKGSGYVLESFEAAVWCFYRSNSFEEAILMATNLGDDADTTAAICGQLAGAYYGYSSIPEKWINTLIHSDYITELAIELYEVNHK